MQIPTARDGSLVFVCEGVESTFHYHLRHAGTHISLCGARVMVTAIPLKNWGVNSRNERLRERWCATCALQANLGEDS